jgi:S-adenosylmethionine decarboxylase
MTIHITPEPAFSYVSFETNANHVRYDDVIPLVMMLFNPGKAVVTVFSNEVTKCFST